MLLALLSDTHDNAPATRAALAMLAPRAPAAYVHAGDLVSPWMLDLFHGLPLHFVFGNNEYDHAALRARARAGGFDCLGEAGELEFPPASGRICLLHGDDGPRLDRAIRSGQYRYVIHGHSHQLRDQRLGNTRVINPGALHRARRKTVALLNLASDTLEVLDVHLPSA